MSEFPSIKNIIKRLKDAIAFGYYDGKSLGYYEDDFKILDAIIKKAQKDDKILQILAKKIKLKSYEIGFEDIIIYEEDEDDYKIIKEWLEGE